MTALISSEEYWDVDGVPLHTYAYSVATIGGSRYNLPPLKGSDSGSAYRPGRTFQPKVADSRIISFMMWVAGINPETGVPDAVDQMVRWNDNWNALRRLFWTPTRQVSLTRRWKLTDPDTEEPTLVVATALAQIANQMDPSMTGRTRADFSVDLLLADPYFRGSEITSDDITVGGPAVTINNPGDDASYYSGLYVDFVGPLTKPRLTNSTPTPDVWAELSGSIASGDTVTLDIGEFLVSPSSFLLNRISHSGARSWFGLLRGSNSVSLTADAGTGHAVVRFKPLYV